MHEELLKKLRYNEQGLIPAITQCHASDKILMMAWMDKRALLETIASGYMHYWSRSRNKLWKKGETSGHFQKWRHFYIDCDADTLLFKVEQTGHACHTGRPSCFFSEYDKGHEKLKIDDNSNNNSNK